MKYYRIYNVIHGGMYKRRLFLPAKYRTSQKRVLGENHKLTDKSEAIDLMRGFARMQRDGYDFVSGISKGDQYRGTPFLKRQIALAELGRYGNGKVIAVTNSKSEVVLL